MKEIKNNQLRIKNVKEEVVLYGFVSNKRKMGELTFVDLRDRWGVIQLVFEKVQTNFTKESVLKVKGKVVERKDKNPNLETGDIEIIVKDFEVLSLAEQLPFIIHDKLEAKEDTRLKHRFLDLRRPMMTSNIVMRHKFNKLVRDFLDKEDFLEIETPYLSKSTPEGARDFLIPTRKSGQFFALPQSPQLYKQLLMSSGFEKYFQIARSFRDEDSRKDRQPEFTQLDMEISYANEEDVQSIVERMFAFVFSKLGIKVKPPFQKMNYWDCIDTYGTDKPDLRYDLKLIELTKLFSNTKFNVFKNAESIKAIHIDKTLSKKDIKSLEEVAKKNGAKGLAFAILETSTGPGFSFFKEELDEIIEITKTKNGTFLFVADNYDVTTQALGAIRVKLNEMFNLADESKNEFVWIVNWPLFIHDSKKDEYEIAHHPFTSPTLEFIDSFEKNKKKAFARSYDLVWNGFEIGGGSVRINDLSLQKRIFKEIGLSEKQANDQFGFFMEAFKYGFPPHAGIAFGIDRILMLLQKQSSIRDVIAFPKNANGISVMEESPSTISDDQLDEYCIRVKKSEK